MVAPALVWPDFDPDKGELDRRSERRLRRGTRRSAPGTGALALAADALGVAAPPAAPLARLAEGLDTGSGAWFRAEPVLLMADRDRLVLFRLSEDPLSDEEAEALIAAAHAHFPAGELRLERSRERSWYALAPDIAPDAGAAPADVEGAGINAALAGGRAAGTGERLLNELQMLWHAHPVNAARRESGRMQANALWLWGGGALPPAPDMAVQGTVLASDAAIRGLASWLGLACGRLAPPVDTDLDDTALVAIGEGEDALGRRWLEALAGRRAGFRLLADRGDWRLRRRLLPHW